MNEMDLPFFLEISPTAGLHLDEASAARAFLGLSKEAALELICESSAYYLEMLMWMGPTAFAYYLHPAISYIESPASRADADAVNVLTAAIRFQLDWEAGNLTQCNSSIVRFCDYVLANFSKFDISPKIYPGLDERITELGIAAQGLNQQVQRRLGV